MPTRIYKEDEVFLRVESTDQSLLKSLNEHFSFKKEGYEFSPQHRAGWDGKVRLFSIKTGRLPLGLYTDLLQFCLDYRFPVHDIDPALNQKPQKAPQIAPESLAYHPRDYQTKSYNKAVNNFRNLIVSATGSGKSLIIYLILRHHIENNTPVLLVVPKVSLVEQMFSDFEEYAKNDPAFDVEHLVQRVYAGHTKEFEKPIVISTWQSLVKLPKRHFKNIGAYICDEVHLAEGKSLRTLSKKLSNAVYRTGFTGTLKDTRAHLSIIRGSFGPVFVASETSELIQSNILSDLEIKAVVLEHSNAPRGKLAYQEEIDWIVQNEMRNTFISMWCGMQTSNTLILTKFVQKHGIPLSEKLQREHPDKKVYLITQDTPVAEREQIRKTVDTQDQCILVSTFGLYSTGINVKNLHNLVFATPIKAKITLLQSIGRVLRKHSTKNKAVVLDIGDDFGKQSNFSYRHLVARLQKYAQNDFTYTCTTVSL